MNQRIQSLMCKVSNGIYKKYVEDFYDIRVCNGKLKDQEIEELQEDLDLLKYFKKGTCDCNKDKLIENLT